MEQETTNIFARNDTFFGVCQAIGEDFGFNPLWLRIAFTLPLFMFPFQTVAGYVALGAVVLVSRLLHPSRAVTANESAVSAVERVIAAEPVTASVVRDEPLPLAA
jgi:phage shock protein PspC (stress-responsive transcriptional regulator)